jgi:hypothetical protein
MTYLMVPENYFFCPYWLLSIFLFLAFIAGGFVALYGYRKHQGGDLLFDIFSAIHRLTDG